jgi:hypothetical protein
VELPNRSTGIGVLASIPVGKRVTIEGTMTTRDGERVIGSPSVVVNSDAPIPGALALNSSALGGGATGLQQGVWGWRMVDGPDGPARAWGEIGGLNNIGLLVRICGRVTEFDAASPMMWFKIDDGSGVNIKCVVPSGVSIDTGWQWVSVTGVSSCEKVGDELHSLIRVRSLDDITPP